MKARGTSGCVCGPCSVANAACEGCSKCLPRYICVTATPDSSGYNCLVPVVFRLRYSCSLQWTGSHAATGVSANVTVINSVDEYGTPVCFTDVTTSEGTVRFDGSLPDGMTATDTVNGISWNLEISPGGGYINPRTWKECSPCKCATCIPAQYCLQLRINTMPSQMPGFFCDALLASAVLSFDCDLGIWSCDPIQAGDETYEFAIHLLSDQCAIKLVISGAVDYEETMFLEGAAQNTCEGDNPPPISGYTCLEATADDPTGDRTGTGRKTPGYQPPCLGEVDYQTGTNWTITLRDYNGNEKGVAVIKEQFCGGNCDPETSPTCTGACPTIDMRELYCLPLTLYASFIDNDTGCQYDPDVIPLPQHGTTYPPGFTAGGWGEIEISPSRCQVYGPTQTSFGCDAGTGYTLQMVLWYDANLLCDPDSPVNLSNYRLGIRVGGIPCDFYGYPGQEVILTPESDSTCDPFVLNFKSGILGTCPGLICCENPPNEVLIRVTL